MDEVQVFFFQFEATVGCRETNSAWHKLLPVGSFNEDSFAKLSNVQPEEPAGLGSYFLDSKSYVPDRLPKPPLDMGILGSKGETLSPVDPKQPQLIQVDARAIVGGAVAVVLIITAGIVMILLFLLYSIFKLKYMQTTKQRYYCNKSTLAGRVCNWHSSPLLAFWHIDVTMRHQIAGVEQAANEIGPFCSCTCCGLSGSK